MEEFKGVIGSTMEEFKGAMIQRMDEMESRIVALLLSQNRSTTGGMLMNENQSSTVVRVELEKKENAAVIIQAFLRTTLVRVKLERAAAKARKRAEVKTQRERACEHLVGEWVCLTPNGNFEESKHFLGFEVYSAGDGLPFLYYRETDSDESLVFEYYESGDRIRARLDGDLLKWSDGTVYYRAGDATSGGDAKLDGDEILGGDAYEDDSSVPLKGRDAFTSIRGVERSLGGAINGIAVCGAGVFAGRKCEFCASDGTFCEANVGGDDEKYKDDFSVAEYSTVACGRMFGAGMCFANLNVERVFLYFHYEYVKCEFG